MNSQRLVQRKDEPGRAPLYQWIMNGPSVSEALLKGDMARLRALQAENAPETLSAGKMLVMTLEVSSIREIWPQ